MTTRTRPTPFPPARASSARSPSSWRPGPFRVPGFATAAALGFAAAAPASPSSHESYDCFTVHAVPSCDDRTCSDATCAVDPSCCETDWDAFCVAEANSECTSRLGDLNGDDRVDPTDLGRMLSFWGLPEGDVTGDLVCSGIDLAVLLANWTG